MIPLISYNTVCEGDDLLIEYAGKHYKGFYISYNVGDHVIYGDATTALVLGQMELFLILNGDHRKQYKEASELGFEACLEYFRSNIHNVNKFSEGVVL